MSLPNRSTALNCTINKYFIIVKYFCLLLLNRWVLLRVLYPSSFASPLRTACRCVRASCSLVLAHSRHSNIKQHRPDWPIEICRVWKCFASSGKQKMLFARRSAMAKEAKKEILTSLGVAFVLNKVNMGLMAVASVLSPSRSGSERWISFGTKCHERSCRCLLLSTRCSNQNCLCNKINFWGVKKITREDAMTGWWWRWIHLYVCTSASPCCGGSWGGKCKYFNTETKAFFLGNFSFRSLSSFREF